MVNEQVTQSISVAPAVATDPQTVRVAVPQVAGGVFSSVAIREILRYGAGAIMGAVFLWLFIRSDERSAAREEKLLEAYQKQTEVTVETKMTIKAMTKSVEVNTEAIREITNMGKDAHRLKSR